MKRSIAATLMGLLLAGSALGQPAPLPESGPAPLLHVRFPGPAGVRVAVVVDGRLQEYPTPVTLGFRPGYVYRLKMTNFPGRPGVSFYPTVEVHGSLRLCPPLKAGSHPAPFVVSEEDVFRVLDGTVLTKVIYLENPDKALAEQGDPNRPVEITFPPQRDLMQEARNMGRPMIAWAMGNRELTEEELIRQAIPNTVLVPGQAGLAPAPVAPFLPLVTPKYVDPILGPRPLTEECMHDGGDTGPPVGIDGRGQLVGLNPEDTVAEYRDSQGRRKIAVSNRVCVCVPRFGVLRTEVGVALARGTTKLIDNQGVVPLERLLALTPVHETGGTEGVTGMVSRTRPSETWNQEGLLVTGRIEGPNVVENIVGTLERSAVCHKEPQTLERPLQLTKWTDCKESQIGDVVTFYLKYSNVGGRPINDVVVSDSLTARLEYVPGSSESSRPAVFTTQPNEAGSAILRWEVKGALRPGESGTVRFQARVR